MTRKKTQNYITLVLLRAMQANRALSRLPNLAMHPKHRSSITQEDIDLHEKYLAIQAREKEQKRIRDAFMAGKYSEIDLDKPIPSRVKHYMRIDLKRKSAMTYTMGGQVFF